MAHRSSRLHAFVPTLHGQAGFSLIEIILVLVLLGIMGTVGVFGLTNVITGFMMSRDAAATAAKGQLAMLRLSREFRVITSVTSGAATSIMFTALHDSGVTPTYTVAQSGSTITMNDGTSTDVLVDQVNTLTLTYYDTYNGAVKTAWDSATSTIIELTIKLNGPNNTTQTFTTRVTPRNL